MADKKPSGQTLNNYQSQMEKKFSQQIKNSQGLEKSKNEAILSKTQNDEILKDIKKRIKDEEHLLDLMKKQGKSLDEIKDKEKFIKDLNKEGIKHLDDMLSNIRKITKEYQEHKKYQDADINGKIAIKREIAEQYANQIRYLDKLEREGQLTEELANKRQQLQDEYNKSKQREQSLTDSLIDAEDKYMTKVQKRAAQQKRIEDAQDRIQKAKIERDAVLNDKNSTVTERNEARAKYAENVKSVKDSIGNNAYEQTAIAFFAATGKSLGEMNDAMSKTLSRMNKVANTFDKAIDDAMTVYTQYMGNIDARLYGTNLTFSKMQKDISSTLGASRYVSQQKMIDNLYTLTESGIAFNLEYRAWLQTVSDRMVTTFDTLDASLTRLIRLQQADLSGASLGSEALMTKFLNSTFKDTSYLNSLYDTVAGILIDSTSQQSATNSIEYQFAVQKWLGALSSVGMSDSAVQSIAQALNWLGSGNVTELNNNSAASTLLNLSAQRAGLDYSQMLLGGTNADNINKLMKAMVVYLQDIASNTGANQVVKSAWGDILNLSMSDMRAITNLTDSDISSIYNTTSTYTKAIKELNTQSGYLGKRTSIAQQIDNVINNTLFTGASAIASNNASYLTWKGSGLIADIGSQFGGLVETVTSVIGGVGQLGTALGTLFGVSGGSVKKTIENIWDFFSSVSGNGNTGSGFGFTLYQSRGEGFTGVAGTGGGTSATKTTSSGSSYSGVATTAADISSTSSKNLTNNASSVSTSSVTSKTSSGRTADDIYSQLFEKQASIKVNVVKVADSVISDLATSMNADKISRIAAILSDGTVNTSINSSSDIYADTASIIRYVQGL